MNIEKKGILSKRQCKFSKYADHNPEMGKKLKEAGTLKKKPVIRSFRKVDPEKVKLYFTEHPDAYLRDAATEFGCCETTITYVCRKLKITRKKDHAL